MAQPRQSTFGTTAEQERILNAAKALNASLKSSNLQIVHNVVEFNAHRLDSDETDASDTEDAEMKDPAIVATDVAAQIVRISLALNPTNH
jgi:hypothetical protein